MKVTLAPAEGTHTKLVPVIVAVVIRETAWLPPVTPPRQAAAERLKLTAVTASGAGKLAEVTKACMLVQPAVFGT